MVELARRSFITGLIALVAAPAIVRAGSLMPVKAIDPTAEIFALLQRRIRSAEDAIAERLRVVLENEFYQSSPIRCRGGLQDLVAGYLPAPDLPALWPHRQVAVEIALHG